MHKPRPVLLTLLFTLLGTAGGLLWWVAQPAPERWHRLAVIADYEAAGSLPPARLEAQGRWLLAHRRARLTGLVGLVALAGVIGLTEGLWYRRGDNAAGMRPLVWTCGKLGLALGPALTSALVLLPQPWPLGWVAAGGSVWSAMSLGLLGFGRPHVR